MNESRHLILRSLENLLAYESLGKGIGCEHGGCITPKIPYLG
jgi:hypothetical protein